MKVILKEWIDIQISRDVAEKLKTLALDNPTFEKLVKQITDELSPRYEYVIQCRDCDRKYSYRCSRELTPEEVNQGGICTYCSDDYK